MTTPLEALLDGPDVLAFVLGTSGAAGASQDQSDRADELAAAIIVEVELVLEWPADRVATAGELADLRTLAKIGVANLWARRDSPNGVVAAFGGDSGQVIRVARDAIDTIRPALIRHRVGAGGNFG